MTIPEFLDMSREIQHVILITVNMKKHNLFSVDLDRSLGGAKNTHARQGNIQRQDICDPSHI